MTDRSPPAEVYPCGDPLNVCGGERKREHQGERDMLVRPYTADEQRVADWLRKRAPQVGAGDDPIGFVLASYEYLHAQRQQAKEALAEVWEWISNWDPPMRQDPEWPSTAQKVVEVVKQ